MDQALTERIEELLQKALDLEPDARAAFLDQACDGDNALRHEVETLLSKEEEAERLETPAILHFAKEGIQTEASLIGKRIGHYIIESRIGAGGMGVVYKAHDEFLNRTVAIKALPAELSKDPYRIERLEREARMASALDHQNVITVIDVVEHDGAKFIISKYVEGLTLRQLLTDPDTGKGRPLSTDESLKIAIQIAGALKAAHTRWVIHRDIKPENIMVRDDGFVLVLDFGIAKLGDEATELPTDGEVASGGASPTKQPALTSAGAIIGTASYMSPEQARGEELDGRTDLFSFGVVLYEMVTGRRLFEGATCVEATRALLRARDPLPANVKIERGTGPLEQVIRRSLQLKRDDRYSSAAEMLEALERIQKRRAGRRSRLIIVVAAVSLILAVGLVTAISLNSVRDEWDERVLRDGHTAAVRRAALSPDGKQLVSVGEDSRVIVWDFLRLKQRGMLTAHNAWVVSAAFSPDSRLFVTGGV